MEEFIKGYCERKNIYPSLYASSIALGWLEEKLKDMGLKIDKIEDTLIEDNNGETVKIVLVHLKTQSIPTVSNVFKEISNFFASRRLFIAEQPQALNQNVKVNQTNVMTLKHMQTDHYWLMDNVDVQSITSLNIGFAYPWHQSWFKFYWNPELRGKNWIYWNKQRPLDLFQLIAIKISLRRAQVNRKLYNMLRDLIKKEMFDLNEEIRFILIDQPSFKRNCYKKYEMLVFYLASQFKYKFSPEVKICHRSDKKRYTTYTHYIHVFRLRTKEKSTSRKPHFDGPRKKSVSFLHTKLETCNILNRNQILKQSDNSPNIMKQYSDKTTLKYLTPKPYGYIEISWDDIYPGVNITLANFSIENWDFLRQYSAREITLINLQFTHQNLIELANFNFEIIKLIDCPCLNDTILFEFIKLRQHNPINYILVLGSTSVTKLFYYMWAEWKMKFLTGCTSELRFSRINIETLQHMIDANFYISDGKLLCDADPEMI